MVTGATSVLRRRFRRAALPLGCYYAVTVLLPLANGAGQAGRTFLAHAAVVAVVPILVIAVAWSVDCCLRALWPRISWRRRTKRRVPSSGPVANRS